MLTVLAVVDFDIKIVFEKMFLLRKARPSKNENEAYGASSKTEF